MTPDTAAARLRAARELRGFVRRSLADGRSAGVIAATLDGLDAVLGYDCAGFGSWDPATRSHRVEASVGYPASALRFMERRMHLDPLFIEVHEVGGPLLMRDLPRARRHGELYEVVIEPLGFTDGLTQCLFARDGRYLGMLNASTSGNSRLADDSIDLLQLLADDLGAVLDPLPPVTAATAALADGGAEGVLVTRGGVRALSAGARTELATGSPLRGLLDDVLAGADPPRSLLLLAGCELFAVTLDRVAGGLVVLHRPAAAPFRLTPRELQVLDGISRGATNVELARVLRVAPRTVATHVEHVLAKTGSPNRAAAARLAARLGLLV